MKVLRLELCKTVATDVSVLVPDDFDERLLQRYPYSVAIVPYLGTKHLDWPDEGEVECTRVKLFKEERAKHEQAMYTCHDISAALAAIAEELANPQES